MELKSDLAKALFDKVIAPIKDKMKRPTTNIIVNKDEEKSDLENLISSNQENAIELPPPPDTIMPVDTDTETPTTNNIVNKDEEKSALEPLLLSIPENPNVLPPVPDTKTFMPLDTDMTEPIMETIPATVESIQPPEPPAPQPSSTEQPAPEPSSTEQPASEPSAPQPSSTEQPAPKPSSLEQPAPQPSVEVVQELPKDNKAIKQLVQALIGVLRKPVTPIISTKPSVEVVQDLPKDNKAIKQLVQSLIGVIRKPASQPPITEPQVIPVPSTENPEETKDIASCDINETCEEQPKSVVNVSKPSATGPVVNESIEEDKPKCFDMSGKLNLITQALSVLFSTIGGLFKFEGAQGTDSYELTEDKKKEGYIYIGKMFMKPEPKPEEHKAEAPEPSSTEQPAPQPSVEVVQKLPKDKAIKQLVQALIGVLRKPVTPIISTKPSVKYISYNPEKKDFFIDEQKEV